MLNPSMIAEHMTVIGSDGQKVGTVDHLEGERIKLTKNDSLAGGQHHFIPLDWVADIDGEVKLSRSSQQAMKEWQTN